MQKDFRGIGAAGRLEEVAPQREVGPFWVLLEVEPLGVQTLEGPRLQDLLGPPLLLVPTCVERCGGRPWGLLGAFLKR